MQLREGADVLVVKPSSLGDIVHGLVVAQSIRDQRPDVTLHWVAANRFAPVVEACPTVNGRVIRYPRERGIRGLLDTCRQLRSLHFDAVLDWQGLARSGAMSLAARSAARIGRSDAREGARIAYTTRAPLPPAGRDSHAVAVLLETLPLLGLRAEVGSPIELPGRTPDEIAALREQPIVLAPNSRGAHKEWPGFVELTHALLMDPTCPPVVWDSHVEWPSPAGLDPARFVNLTGKTGLDEMVGAVRAARLLVVNDAGPLHIAAAIGTPVLGLFGPTSAARFGPYPLARETHAVLEAPDGELGRLDVDTVTTTVRAMLARDADGEDGPTGGGYA